MQSAVRSARYIHSCLAVLLLGLAIGPGVESQEPSVGPDRVGYTSLQPGNWDIYLFAAPGQSPRRLTNHPGLDYDPVVSPDGRWLVFCSERRGNPDLFVLDLRHEGEPHLLVDSDVLEDQAAFSPDGKQLAFVSTSSGNADIFVIPFEPERTQSLTAAANVTRNPAGDFRPAFSPDGKTLAFTSDRDVPVTALSVTERVRGGHIHLLELSSGNVQRLTSGPGWNGSPTWSSDGKQIAFYADRALRRFIEHRPEIWVMNTDGSEQHPITATGMPSLSPRFLPNGRIVHTRKNAARSIWQIVSVNPDGSGERIESDPPVQLTSAFNAATSMGTCAWYCAGWNNYWGPSPGPSPGSIVAYGPGPNPPEPSGGYGWNTRGPAVNTEADVFKTGPVLVSGAPFRRDLPGRSIDLYPIRYFLFALLPRENSLLHVGPVLNSELYASALDGSRQRRLLSSDRADLRGVSATLSISQNGQWVAFTGGSSPGLQAVSERDVWKMRIDGTALQNLTPNSPGLDSDASFCSGGRLVFVSGRRGHLDLHIMNDDGTGVRALTDDEAIDLFPACSPAANQIAFVSNRGQPISERLVSTANGQTRRIVSTLFDVYLLDFNSEGRAGRLRRLTNNEGQEGHVAFSPDGEWIIFTSEQGGLSDEEPVVQSVIFAGQMYGEMYAYRIADGTTVRLTHNKWEEGVPSWAAAVASSR